MPKKREPEHQRITRYFNDVLLITTHEKLAPILGVSINTISNNKRDIGSMKVKTFIKLAEYRAANIDKITAAKIEGGVR